MRMRRKKARRDLQRIEKNDENEYRRSRCTYLFKPDRSLICWKIHRRLIMVRNIETHVVTWSCWNSSDQRWSTWWIFHWLNVQRIGALLSWHLSFEENIGFDGGSNSIDSSFVRSFDLLLFIQSIGRSTWISPVFFHRCPIKFENCWRKRRTSSWIIPRPKRKWSKRPMTMRGDPPERFFKNYLNCPIRINFTTK